VNDGRSVGAVDHTNLEQLAGRVAAHKHGEAVIDVLDEDWVAEGRIMSSARMPYLRVGGRWHSRVVVRGPRSGWSRKHASSVGLLQGQVEAEHLVEVGEQVSSDETDTLAAAL
jgi:hypothetical protein